MFSNIIPCLQETSMENPENFRCQLSFLLLLYKQTTKNSQDSREADSQMKEHQVSDSKKKKKRYMILSQLANQQLIVRGPQLCLQIYFLDQQVLKKYSSAASVATSLNYDVFRSFNTIILSDPKLNNEDLQTLQIS